MKTQTPEGGLSQKAVSMWETILIIWVALELFGIGPLTGLHG
jgi:hypothetical protein